MAEVYVRKRYFDIQYSYKNDALLDQMYQLLTQLLKYSDGREFTLEKGPPLRFTFQSLGGTEVLMVQDEIERGALTDLVYYLERLGFLNLIRPNVYQINIPIEVP